MLSHMRTTMNLSEELYRSARVRAAQEGRTVTSVMEEALRSWLSKDKPESKAYRATPVAMGKAGVSPVDLNDNAAVRELMDAQALGDDANS